MQHLVKTLRLLAFAGLAGFLQSGVAQPARALGPASVSALAHDLSGAVVNISTSRHVAEGVGEPYPDAPDGSPLGDMFDELNPNSGEGEDAMREARSLGSGFVVSAEGLIVTNNHVIEGAEEILVFLTDGTRLPAKVVGADDKTDLAVLRIEAGHPLDFVQFGDSDTAEVGDWVMAIGNPFGLGGSVTLGIVSARNRDINSGPYDNFIQTDAAINQGNSGGPLFDMDGKVVGINTAIIARAGGALGIGFAVPGNLAKPVIDQLVAYGETRRGWLGVSIQEVSEDIALSLGRTDTHGAMVVEVTEQGPAAGVLMDGDVILEFDGKPIVKMRDLPRLVAETAIGKAVQVRVLRGGIEEMFGIILGRLESGEPIIARAEVPELPVVPEPANATPTLSDLVGLQTAPLDPEKRNEFGIIDEVNGVVITDVTKGSDAEDKGILAGLVIEEVNQQTISDVTQVANLVGEAREAGRPAVLFKLADPTGSRRFVAVRLR